MSDMDAFTKMMNVEFDSEADQYLDKLLINLQLTQMDRRMKGREPMTMRDLTWKLMTEVRDDKYANVAVALAAALFRLSEVEE